METFQEHYLSMKRTIAARKLNVDMALIDRAVDYAREKHKDQKRKDGSPYIIHPLAVAEIVAEIGLDTDAILGALLHDCIEDTDSTYDDIARNFGPTVASLVEGVTKLTRVEYSTLEEQQMENLRKMFMAMSKDIRVILIKIADRLHNTRTMQFQSPEKQISKSRETMDIYAPLAHRLGMQKIKWELEDTSLKYLDPEGYNEIMRYLNAHQAEADAFMKAIQSKITTRLSAVGIHGSIYGRIKHVYSIYRKMKAQNKTIDELYDMYAFRVIVDSIPDCYNVLGHIHDLFNLVPGRFKDYISTPKPNMYQSLHTTVIGQQGIPFEVQIRTWEMHETAEYGIAAHWKYKQGVAGGDEKQFEWVRRLLETQQDSDAEDYIHSLKVDMFDDEVFVFTPKGDVVNMPAGATPIDLAYAIHSAVGNRMTGCKLNGRIAPIDSQLKNGDIVEILTSKEAHGPSRDWLKICRTSQAKNKINQWFKRERRDENIEHGKELIERELRRIGNTHEQLFKQEWIAILLRRYGFQSIDDLYASVGYGGLTAQKVVFRLRDEWTKLNKTLEAKKNLEAVYNEESKTVQAEPAKRHASSKGIVVKDIDNCLVRLARCCNPVAGDDIVGFITKGRGVSVHRRDCPNMNPQSMSEEDKGRFIDVWWDDERSTSYIANLQVEAPDRDGVLLEITNILSALKIPFKSVNAYVNKKGIAIIQIGVEIRNTSDLALLKKKIVQIQGVTSVTRLQN